jgi:hypothetical protein
MDCKLPEHREKAGKTGEVGLPAPSRLAHSPAAQRGYSLPGRTRSSTLELWFFSVRENARWPRSFRMRKLSMWVFCTFGQLDKGTLA